MTKRLLNIAIGSFLFLALTILSSGQKSEDKVTADSALAELRKCITSPIAQHLTRPESPGRQLVSGRTHIAEILSCADSRSR
jgi:hypothetical protein